MAGEVPSGSITGTTGSDGNAVFSTAQTYYSPIIVTTNGVVQNPPATHYSYNAATRTLTFLAPFIPAVVNGVADSIFIDGITLPGTVIGGVDNGAGGSRSLASLRAMVRSESDTENDPHITDPELNIWINQSLYRLYDLLIQSFGDDYFSTQATIPLDGVSTQFNLPDGILYSAALPYYKGALVEAISGGFASPQAPVTLHRFNLAEKNRFSRPYQAAMPAILPRYRIMGSNPGTITFTPVPQAMNVRLWYAPKLSPLVADTDVADDFSGWLQLVVVDCAIKALGKQERDATLLAARKVTLVADIKQAAANRDVGEPSTVSMTEGNGVGLGGGPWGGGYGGGGFY